MVMIHRKTASFKTLTSKFGYKMYQQFDVNVLKNEFYPNGSLKLLFYTFIILLSSRNVVYVVVVLKTKKQFNVVLQHVKKQWIMVSIFMYIICRSI